MNFIKTFLAALLAVIVANILAGIFFMLIFAGMMASIGAGTRHIAIPPNSILRLDFAEGVTDSPDNSPFHSAGLFGGGVYLNRSNSLLQILGAIENASYDDNIRGIYINITGGDISLANVEEVRAALLKFREDSGKFVVAYSDVYSQAGYYLASVADGVYIHPEGAVSWQGLASQVMFYKGTLEKLGVEVEVVRHGSFKSAVEPFMLTGMSAENRMQLDAMLGSVWETMLEDISASRGPDPESLSRYATDLMLADAGDALRLNFVDAILYPDQVGELLTRLAISGGAAIDREVAEIQQHEGNITNGTAVEAEVVEPDYYMSAEAPAMIDLPDYIAAIGQTGLWQKGDRIAIIYIDGDIIDGVDTGGSVGGSSVAEKLSNVRYDNSVKGVVVRVNSPGGSALASDVIWREMELLRREKPLIVSMGGYAASGGYWVSSPADLILADRSTLTGSIGVFGLIPNAGKALRDKLGITTDIVRTNPHADMGSLFRPLDNAERNYLQGSIERVYKTFIAHVASGRNLSEERVDEIGGGRVWTGAQALEIGLVDGIGGLTEAIALCADRAGIAGSYTIYEVVEKPDTISALLRSFSSSVRTDAALRSELGETFVQYRNMRNMLGQPGVQARLPYEIEIR